MNFVDKLNEAIYRNQSLLSMELSPDPRVWPKQLGTGENGNIHTEGLREWLEFLVVETVDAVCAYTLSLDFYRVLGSTGIPLLRQTLAVIPPHIPVILDAQHSDLRTSRLFAQMIFQQWQVDAVTLNPLLGQDGVTPFLIYPDKYVFVRAAIANPSTALLQNYPNPNSPFYLHLVDQAKTWGSPEQLGLEISGSPDLIQRIRQLAPERLILAPEIPTDQDSLALFLNAGLTPNGDGMVMVSPPDLLMQADPRSAIHTLRDQINQIRSDISPENPACSVWFSNICLLQQHPYKDLILQLYEIGCIQFGDFVQASGETFPYYIDLRTIISHPQVFEQVLKAYIDILQTLTFDRIAGIPYGSLPTATGLGLRLNHPMIFPRKEVKSHGTRRLVEGDFQPGETAVVIDDVMITGNSVLEGIGKLESVGLIIKDVVVLIDHERDVSQTLNQRGYHAHAVLKFSEIAQTLYAAGRIDFSQLDLLLGHG
ncbi:MAG: bifunctional orotidine-5'-phosphate decarboxylase/orotate phosphoribosyltransferase [Synechocystis sp.]|nr:bifunctional orotidine-5'-phosphate decarboxylase/orotate phosphoribosyltransferase [Synechocystis sp.]